MVRRSIGNISLKTVSLHLTTARDVPIRATKKIHARGHPTPVASRTLVEYAQPKMVDMRAAAEARSAETPYRDTTSLLRPRPGGTARCCAPQFTARESRGLEAFLDAT